MSDATPSAAPPAPDPLLAGGLPGRTVKFGVGGHEFYLHLVEREKPPGDEGVDVLVGIQMTCGKVGSTVRGFMQAWCEAVSGELARGASLEELCNRHIGSQFEPSGFTGRDDIERATSVHDFVFRWIALRYLPAGWQPRPYGQMELAR